MAFWLLKTEPDAFSWSQQVARGEAGEPWTGVRNHQARNFLRAMTPGDLCLFYHTGEERAVVGVVEVVRGPYPDPEEPDWTLVDVAARSALPRRVTLASIKAEQALSGMVLARNPRLSVQPVTAEEWARVMDMGGLA